MLRNWCLDEYKYLRCRLRRMLAKEQPYYPSRHITALLPNFISTQAGDHRNVRLEM